MGETSVKKIGLFGLIGMVVSSCIGSGIFGLTGQLSAVSSPGAIIIAWIITGVGFGALALSLSNLSQKKPELKGIFEYATEGFGPFAGFLSGWGYWFSAWMGSVAFATMMMSTLGYFFPMFLNNSVPAIIGASIFNWALTLLVMRGVESAAFLNAIVMVCKVASIGVFILFAIFLFNADVFTAGFWGNLASNASAMASGEADMGSIPNQIINCLIVMMWVFIGVEGATVMSSRAEKKSDVGKAAIIGLIILIVIYMASSVLPYGYMSYEEIAQLEFPAMLYVFDSMAPGWGGPFITIAIVIAIAGSWLSFTMLPAETTSEMAECKIMPASWGKLNKYRAPQLSLLVIAACIQAFLITFFFTEDAYNLAISIATVAIVVTWALCAAYQVKLAIETKDVKNLIIGAVAVIFQVVGCLLAGWTYLLLSCIGFALGIPFYVKARKENGRSITSGEKVAFVVVCAAAIAGIVGVATGWIAI